MASDIDALLKRATRAGQKRDAFRALMQDVHAYALPERDGWSSYGYGQNRHVRVYDSTAVVSAGRFANRLQQALFPPQQRWARLSLPPELEDDDELQEVGESLEGATAKLFAHIHASNFDMAVNEWAQELGAGTACMLIENGRQGTRRSRAPLLRFQAIPASAVAFDEGPFGGVEGVFFDQVLTHRNIRRTYPDIREMPDALAEAERGNPEGEAELLQATTYDAGEDAWIFEVVHKASRSILVERRYRTSPWVVTRWTKAPGEAHGRGPLTQALPDIRTVNKLVELALISGSYATNPMWTVLDDGVTNIGTLQIRPGVAIPVRSNGGVAGPSIKALEMPANLQVNDALRDGMTTRIRQVLFDDPLPPEVQVGLTATEVVERIRRFQQDTGAFGRLHTDAAVPIVARCLDILDEAGELAGDRFAGLMDAVRDDAVRIRASSPLSQAQDQADVQAVRGCIQGATQLGELGASIIRKGLRVDDVGPWIARRVGVPASLIPTADEVQQQAQADAQAAQTSEMLSSPAVAQVAGQVARAATTPQQGDQPR